MEKRKEEKDGTAKRQSSIKEVKKGSKEKGGK
jgi:hypothetical protein